VGVYHPATQAKSAFQQDGKRVYVYMYWQQAVLAFSGCEGNRRSGTTVATHDSAGGYTME